MRFEGKNVEEAKAQACIKLEKTLKELDIEVISEGSKGFLGLGAKKAVIEVFELGKRPKKPKEKPEIKKEEIKKKENKQPEKKNNETKAKLKKEMKPKEKVKELVKKPKTVEKIEKSVEGDLYKNIKTVVEKEDRLKDQEVQIAKVVEEDIEEFDAYDELRDFLTRLLEKMGIVATLDMIEDKERFDINVNIETEQSTQVIGKRGVILEAIQVLTNTVLIMKRGRYWIKLDCDNYREKRYNAVKGLAKRSAYKVKKYKKRVYIDRLSSSERRIVHALLSGETELETHSEGRDPYRKLVISYKR